MLRALLKSRSKKKEITTLQTRMGNAQSVKDLPTFQQYAKQRSLQVAEPSTETVLQDYFRCVGYAYANPKQSSLYLNDIKKRFFHAECVFRWSWSEERPETSISKTLSYIRTPDSADDANNAYKSVVQALLKKPQVYAQILDDMRIRYFDPNFSCNYATPQNQDFTPVFR